MSNLLEFQPPWNWCSLRQPDYDLNDIILRAVALFLTRTCREKNKDGFLEGNTILDVCCHEGLVLQISIRHQKDFPKIFLYAYVKYCSTQENLHWRFLEFRCLCKSYSSIEHRTVFLEIPGFMVSTARCNKYGKHTYIKWLYHVTCWCSNGIASGGGPE